MKPQKTVRVEIEYDNGEVHRLTGEQAEKWTESVNGQITIGHVHGISFPKFDWTIIHTPKKT